MLKVTVSHWLCVSGVGREISDRATCSSGDSREISGRVICSSDDGHEISSRPICSSDDGQWLYTTDTYGIYDLRDLILIQDMSCISAPRRAWKKSFLTPIITRTLTNPYM